MEYSNSRKKAKKKHRWADWKLTLMALPFVAHLIAFHYVPLFGWSFAFINYRPGRKLANLKFEGLKYFKLVGYYWPQISRALTNTLALNLLGLTVAWLPMVFAILLNEIRGKRTRKAIQSLVTLPHFVSWVIIYSLIFQIFSVNGMLNSLLMSAGLIQRPTNLLANPDWSWPFMIFLDNWKGLGWGSIVYLAAIAGIDTELYDAAIVDGAGRVACARYITIPSLMPTFIVLLVMNMGSLLSNGVQKYLLFANSVTLTKLEVLDLFVFNLGLVTQDYSFATAVGILKTIVSIIMITLANIIAKKYRGSTIF